MSDLLDLDYETTVPADLVSRAMAQAVGIRRRRRAGAAGGAALSVAIVAAAIPIALSGGDRAAHPPGPASTPPEPSQYVAYTTDNGDSALVVTTAGTTLRTLASKIIQPGGLSPDRKTLYVALGAHADGSKPCGYDWTAVDVATGAKHHVLDGVTGIYQLVAGPNGAFVYRQDDCTAIATGTPTHASSTQIVVRTADGNSTAKPVPGNAIIDAVSSDGSTVLVSDASTGVLRVVRLESSLPPASVTAPDGCTYTDAGFAADGGIIASRTCGAGTDTGPRGSIVSIDPDSLAVLVTTAVGTASSAASSLSVDATGSQVLVTFTGPGSYSGLVHDDLRTGVVTPVAVPNARLLDAIW